jgi:endogenous inhibitor of DNA gyrase (YacG/DUF329 family)
MTPPPDKQVPPIRAVRTEARCPICSKAVTAPYRPFCSKRCADIDLGRWLKEGYRVPTEEGPDDADSGGNRGSGEVSGQDR